MAMLAKIAGFVLRARDRNVTAWFYEDLGLTTHEHQHGGPLHYEVLPMAENCVLEIYDASPRFPVDALMIEVDSIQAALDVAVKYGLVPKSKGQAMPGVSFVYINDPDGRSLMLVEKK